MTLATVVAWFAFAPAALVTIFNLWSRIHNLGRKRFVSSVMVVPSILSIISISVLSNTVEMLRASGHQTINTRPVLILTAIIVAADIPLSLGLASISRRR
jgi:hypothetical protein